MSKRTLGGLVFLLSVATASAQNDFFWEEVVPQWKANKEKLASAQVIARSRRTSGLHTQPKPAEPGVLRFFLKNGMQKVELEKKDTLIAAFGDDSKVTFGVVRANLEDPSLPLVVVNAGKSQRKRFSTADPLFREMAKLYAASTLVNSCMHLEDLKPDNPSVQLASIEKRDNSATVILEQTGLLETIIELKLDGSHHWAITEWKETNENEHYVARGVNVYYDDTLFGRAFPKSVSFEEVQAGQLREAIVTEFELPVRCSIPTEEFRITHYGFNQPSIPKSPEKLSPQRNRTRPIYMGLAVVGLMLIALAIWNTTRSE